jgi:hypothetical protein
MKPQTPTSPDDAERPPDKARHGYRNDVNWEGGSGRQPYGNQGQHGGTPVPAAGPEVAQGNRGSRSGNTVEQVERAKRKP